MPAVVHRLMPSILVLPLLLGSAIIGGCGSDDTDPTGPSASPVTLTIDWRAVLGDEVLVPVESTVTNAAGNEFNVDRFEFLLTDVVLERIDGRVDTLATELYVDALDEDASRIEFLEVPDVVYRTLRFRWGVAPGANVSGALRSGYDGMLWPPPLGGGYHCMRLEGTWTQDGSDPTTFLLHAGNLQFAGAVTNGSVVVEVDLPDELATTGATSRELVVYVDALELLDDPALDFGAPWTDQLDCTIAPETCTLGFPSMPSHEAQQLIRDNMGDVFRTIPSPGILTGPQVFDPTPSVRYTNPEYLEGTFTLNSMPQPSDNPTTIEGVELGRVLFYDPILSLDNTVSCASCHRQGAAFADVTPVSFGVDGRAGRFNAPALINLAWSGDAIASESPRHAGIFWDGRAPNLESQALEPVPNEVEMRLPWSEAIARLRASADYRQRFARAFPGEPISSDLVTKAIAQFQRTLVSFDSKYDQVLRQEAEFTEQERRGYIAFNLESGDCFHCHGHPFFLQDVGSLNFANNGLDSTFEPDMRGLANVTGDERDVGRFRVPTLRNIEYTAPYMHDGRFATLEDVIDHYSAGIHFDSPNLDANLRTRAGRPPMSEDLKADLLAFLKTLSDPSFLVNPAYTDPVTEDGP